MKIRVSTAQTTQGRTGCNTRGTTGRARGLAMAASGWLPLCLLDLDTYMPIMPVWKPEGLMLARSIRFLCQNPC